LITRRSEPVRLGWRVGRGSRRQAALAGDVLPQAALQLGWAVLRDSRRSSGQHGAAWVRAPLHAAPGWLGYR
jgi:hypothetical protein